MDKWFKDILPDKDPYHNRGRDQMRKKGVRNSSACDYSWCMMSTDIVKWRKTNDYENFEEGMINMKILKKGGNREKRGEEETKSMRLCILVHFLVFNLSSRNKKHYCLSTKQGA
jgi:hypothetical protein